MLFTKLPDQFNPSGDACKRPVPISLFPTATTALLDAARAVTRNETDVPRVQVTPPVEVMITPPSPAAMNRLPIAVTARKVSVVPDSRSVQVKALGEVMIVPWSPTATNVLFAYATARKVFCVGRDTPSHSRPSVVVNTSGYVPDTEPTATKRPTPKAMPYRISSLLPLYKTHRDQFKPSAEAVARVLVRPVARNIPLP